MAKSNEPFIIWDGFSKMVSNMSTDNEPAKKYGTEKTKITQIIKGKGNHFWVPKKPCVHNECLR